MMVRLTLGVLWLAAASAALGQDVRTTSAEKSTARPIARTEGRKILAAIPAVDAGVESETDCSHLVHDIYEQAGFPYGYVTSRELYTGIASFTRVRGPQAGDLVVWRGHVGIVIDPKEHSFFSFVRSGADTQFYDSPYWRARGIPRFFRYVAEKQSRGDRTLEAADWTGEEPARGDGGGGENYRSAKPSKPVNARASRAIAATDGSNPAVAEIPRETDFQVAGKNPSPEEIAAAFVEMNQNGGDFLRTGGLDSSGKSVIVVYRELQVSSVQIKGKRGTALVRVESLGATTSATQTDSTAGWREQPVAFEKTKRGWVMRQIEGVAYVKRAVALQVLSARLADLARKPEVGPAHEREQKQIIRFLNLLVTDNSNTASADNN